MVLMLRTFPSFFKFLQDTIDSNKLWNGRGKSSWAWPGPPWPVLLLPVEHEYLMLGPWCNWYFEETSLLSPDAFSCLSGSDYRADTRFRVDTETGCVCTHSQTHGNNYSVGGIGALSACLFARAVCLIEVHCQRWSIWLLTEQTVSF